MLATRAFIELPPAFQTRMLFRRIPRFSAATSFTETSGSDGFPLHHSPSRISVAAGTSSLQVNTKTVLVKRRVATPVDICSTGLPSTDDSVAETAGVSGWLFVIA